MPFASDRVLMRYGVTLAPQLSTIPSDAQVVVVIDGSFSMDFRAAGVSSYGMGLSFGVGPFLLGLLADEVGAHTALLLIPLFLAGAAVLVLGLRGSAGAPQVGDRPAEIVEQMA